jgi:succinate-semialdehyde dehydrogenase/glutarate-semialdehyde dehydrogenase
VDAPSTISESARLNPFGIERADLLREEAFIDGQWISPGRTFRVLNPADDQLIAEVAEGDPEMARQAVEAAARAFASWGRQTTAIRAAFLLEWRSLMLRHEADLAKLIAWESGKPLAEARGEVAYGASYLEWFAHEARREGGEIIPSAVAGRELIVLREPVGVVAAITPWNFPLAMITRKLAPALAAGCTVVAKPAEDTPLTALALMVLAQEAGLPAGVMNVVAASREATPAVTEAWLADPRVRKLSFTGSTAVGKLLARRSADTLKRLSLELGGDAPFIIFEDANLDIAVEALLKAKLRNAGQTCIAANRILVHSSVVDEVLSRLKRAVDELTVGPSHEGAFDIGPLINSRALAKVDRLVGEMVERGARVLAGGARLDGAGAFYAPTLLADVPLDSTGGAEEIFGPVVAVSTFVSEDKAIRLANATCYGLAAYVCTSDLQRTWRLARRLESGLVGVNEGAISTAAAPFGGVKESGYGREGSIHGLAEYQNLKYVCFGGLNHT